MKLVRPNQFVRVTSGRYEGSIGITTVGTSYFSIDVFLFRPFAGAKWIRPSMTEPWEGQVTEHETGVLQQWERGAGYDLKTALSPQNDARLKATSEMTRREAVNALHFGVIYGAGDSVAARLEAAKTAALLLDKKEGDTD